MVKEIYWKAYLKDKALRNYDRARALWNEEMTEGAWIGLLEAKEICDTLGIVIEEG